MASARDSGSGKPNMALDLDGLKNKEPKTMKNNLMGFGPGTSRVAKDDEQDIADRARCKTYHLYNLSSSLSNNI